MIQFEIPISFQYKYDFFILLTPIFIYRRPHKIHYFSEPQPLNYNNMCQFPFNYIDTTYTDSIQPHILVSFQYKYDFFILLAPTFIYRRPHKIHYFSEPKPLNDNNMCQFPSNYIDTTYTDSIQPHILVSFQYKYDFCHIFSSNFHLSAPT